MRVNENRSRATRGSASDIAQVLGVSKAAVSYALNGKPGISDETRRSIIELARAYGIEVPERATNMHTIPSLVGLVLADLSNPFYQELGVAVAEVARSHNLNTLLAHTGDRPKDLLSTVQTMTQHGVNGIILTATQDGDASVARLLRNANLPYVQVSRKMPTVRAAFVGIDNKNAAKDMALHMVSHGYKKIALAIGPRRSSASNERHVGYLEGLIESGLSTPTEWIVRTDLGTGGGYNAAKHFRSLKRGLPEAILCGSDAIAFGIIEDFNAHGISVPNDVAVGGFDGVTPAVWPGFSLTTIVQPIRAMANQAVVQLENLMRNERVKQTDIVCPYELHIGNSCRCQPI